MERLGKPVEIPFEKAADIKTTPSTVNGSRDFDSPCGRFMAMTSIAIPEL